MPLDGIKVVDLTRLAPGPFCTMVLGDMGAEVIRVEEPSRSSEPDVDAERRAAFNALNRNKRSIGLDLKLPQAQEALQRLCRDADVFVEGFRPGVVQRLGCDYDTLSAANPGLVYCSISGYGQDGPYRDLVGHDINYLSIGGALGLIGQEDGTPTIPYNIIADYAAGGLQAVVGIMGALMAREKLGRGQYVDIAMTDGVAYMLAAVASDFFREGIVPRPGAMPLNGGAPYYNTYRCKDGKYLSIGCIEPRFWENLCTALSTEEFIPHQHEQERYPEIFDRFRRIFGSRTRDEWWETLREAGDVAVGPVYSLDEVFEDSQMRHRGMSQEVGRGNGEPVRQVGVGPKLSRTPAKARHAGALSGEHTHEVLRELGYSSEQIADIVQPGRTE
jgi:crotonobetainyl-CoA:carnitine CoA-transferase CaiB-like acyl-CoA transferase